MDRRRGLTRRQEIARRLANAVDDTFAVARAGLQKSVGFRHTVAHHRRETIAFGRRLNALLERVREPRE